jgi:hypothetical protein
VWHGYQKR